MPLVPLDIINTWYRRDSAVYKSFAFLFQNPLWYKSIPSGMSVCVFWWSAVFSFLLFRPLVYLVLGATALVKVLRLGRVVEWTDRMALKLIRSDERDHPPVLPTVMVTVLAVLIVAVVALLGYGLTYLAIGVVSDYHAAGILFALFTPIACLASFIACEAYISSRRYCDDRCKVEVYLYTLLGLSLVAAWVLHPSEAMFVFVTFPVTIVTDLGSLLWFLLTGLGHGIVVAAVWVGHLTVAALAGILWGLAALAIIAVLGFIAYKVDQWVAKRPPSKPAPAPQVKDDKTISRSIINARLDTISDILWSNDTSPGYAHRGQDWWERYVRANKEALLPYVSRPGKGNWDIPPKDLRAQLVAQALERSRAEIAARQARDAKCKAVTDALWVVVGPIVRLTTGVSRAIWGGTKTVAKHTGIACVYVWVLIKSKKQGACPYLRFHD